MRISEAYEHEPIRQYQAEEKCPQDSQNSCGKVATQCVDIAAALTLTPMATFGSVTVACQGNPEITCVTNADGVSCTVTMIQQVCVSVPVNYGVALTAEEPTIACANNSCIGCGCC